MSATKVDVNLRQHILSPAHGLDRVKLSIQKGPLGSFDREDGELIQKLLNEHYKEKRNAQADYALACAGLGCM